MELILVISFLILAVAILIYWIVIDFRNKEPVPFTSSCIIGTIYAVLFISFITSDHSGILPLLAYFAALVLVAVIIWIGAIVAIIRNSRRNNKRRM